MKILLLLMFLTISCNKNNNEFIEIIKVDSSITKNCHFFKKKNSDTLKFVRKVEILENTLNDTILIGNAILSPKYLGEFEYTQLEDRDDVTLDLRYSNPLADRICINQYHEKKSKGILKLKLKTRD